MTPDTQRVRGKTSGWMRGAAMAAVASVALLGAQHASPALAAPDDGRAELVVTAGSDRTGTDAGDVSGLEGLTFAVIPGAAGQRPTSDEGAVATFASGADGRGVLSSLEPSAEGYWVVPVSAPEGYSVIERETRARFDGAQAVVLDRYGFHTGAVSAGQTLEIPAGFEADNVGSDPAYLNDAGFVAAPRDNPELQTLACEEGIDITLVADLSFSTDGQFGPLGSPYRDAVNSFIDGMAGSEGSTLRLATFSGTAPAAGQEDTTRAYSMADDADVQAAHDRVASLNRVERGGSYLQGTNWDAGLSQLADSAADTDLVVFLTDGLPTLDNDEISDLDPNAGGNTNQLRTKIRNIDFAVASANTLKGGGTRIVAAGVGPVGAADYAVPNLAAISGPVAGSDFYQTGWDSLAESLQQIIDDACS
ncbi:hypothetical protein, partial [Microbacterium sp. gxy059]|uniref:hypothetical protein n=1 Tax=Microbacterium sp. gxy059 TaxID=2957199 RepID=UPI003D971BC1